MKKIILLFIVLFLIRFDVISQNNLGKSDDLNRLSLNVYVPEQTIKLSEVNSNNLKNKVSQIVSKYGISGNSEGGRFIVVPVINLVSKETAPTAPPMTSVSLEVTLYIGDGMEGIKFSSTTFSVKGLGASEGKAYNDAFNKLNANAPGVAEFINNGKNKIIEYYNSKCDFILSDAKSLSDQNKLDEAIYKLNSVPEVCKECYATASRLAVEYYLKAQERDCKIKLQQAENIWSANPTEQGAQEAASLLNQIDPETSCYSKAKILINSINKTITTKIEYIEAFNRKLVLLNKSNNFELEKARIGAVRDIAVAYANNRPKTIVYNVVGWW
jgi:hypothetical protein